LHPLVLHDSPSIHDIDIASGPAKHPPVTQDDTYVEPYIPEVPVAAATPTHAPSDAEQPRHAVANYVLML